MRFHVIKPALSILAIQLFTLFIMFYQQFFHGFLFFIFFHYRAFPSEVVTLEEEWGDHLVDNKQLDAAINHYIEAGRTLKALESATNAKQWKKAVQIIQVIDDSSGDLNKYYFQLGQHFASVREYRMAEKFYLEGGQHKNAIEMYNGAGMWEEAHALAKR